MHFGSRYGRDDGAPVGEEGHEPFGFQAPQRLPQRDRAHPQIPRELRLVEHLPRPEVAPENLVPDPLGDAGDESLVVRIVLHVGNPRSQLPQEKSPPSCKESSNRPFDSNWMWMGARGLQKQKIMKAN